MSLKRFHIFFITICSLLALFMVGWGLYYFKTLGSRSALLFAGIGLGGLILLGIYLKWFLQKYSKMLSLALGLWLGAWLIFPRLSLACGTCYKDPNDPLTKGAIAGVALLGVVIVGVLGGILYLMRAYVKKARQLNLEV